VRGVDADPSRRAVVVGLVHFAAEAGCSVDAEGIETQAERATVTELGVTLGQGYLLAKPAPAETWHVATPKGGAPVQSLRHVVRRSRLSGLPRETDRSSGGGLRPDWRVVFQGAVAFLAALLVQNAATRRIPGMTVSASTGSLRSRLRRRLKPFEPPSPRGGRFRRGPTASPIGPADSSALARGEPAATDLDPFERPLASRERTDGFIVLAPDAPSPVVG
jgi:hypothetical protein